MRVLLLRRRVDEAGCPLLAGTLVAEGAGELAVGAAMLALALALGFAPLPGVPDLIWIVPALLGVLALAAVVARVPRLRAVAAGVGAGCAPLREPGAYARGVLPWQLLSRLCRLAALGCFLAAFGLPATPAAVLLVVGAQTGGRLLPFAPASVGAGAAMLAGAFAPVTGHAVPAGQVAAFFLGTSAVLTVVGTAISLTICLRAVSWRRLLAAVRPARRAPGARPRPRPGRAAGWPDAAVAGRAPPRRRAGSRARRPPRPPRCRTRSGCRSRPPRGRSPGPTATPAP